jgi:hypothetical protein
LERDFHSRGKKNEKPDNSYNRGLKRWQGGEYGSQDRAAFREERANVIIDKQGIAEVE